VRAERGRRWRGWFPFSACGSRRVHVCRDCQLAARLSRFGCFARPRAFFAGPGNTMVVGERCPCGFRTLHGSCGCPRSPRSVGRDRDLVLSRVSGDFCGSTSLVWLAIRTSGSYLNETNVWLEHSRRNRPSVRAIQRTVAQFRVIRLGRLFARRTATRDYGRRATWPIVWLIVSA